MATQAATLGEEDGCDESLEVYGDIP